MANEQYIMNKLSQALDTLDTTDNILTRIFYVPKLFRNLVKSFDIDHFERQIISLDPTTIHDSIVFLGEEYHQQRLLPASRFFKTSKLPLPYWAKYIQYHILSRMYHESAFGWGIELFWSPRRNASLGEHFDNDDVYTIQIYGTKRWVIDPPDLDRLTRLDKKGKISRQGPYDAWVRNNKKKPVRFLKPNVIIMNPGDFLAVPCFSLHKVTTHTLGRNLSINASVCQEQRYNQPSKIGYYNNSK